MGNPPTKDAKGNLIDRMGTRGVLSSIREGDREGPTARGSDTNSRATTGSKIFITPPNSKPSKVVPDDIRDRLDRYVRRGMTQLDPSAKDFFVKTNSSFWEMKSKRRYEGARRALTAAGFETPEDDAKVARILEEQVPKDQHYRYDPDQDGSKMWERTPPGITDPGTRLGRIKIVQALIMQHHGEVRTFGSGPWLRYDRDITEDMTNVTLVKLKKNANGYFPFDDGDCFLLASSECESHENSLAVKMQDDVFDAMMQGSDEPMPAAGPPDAAEGPRVAVAPVPLPAASVGPAAAAPSEPPTNEEVRQEPEDPDAVKEEPSSAALNVWSWAWRLELVPEPGNDFASVAREDLEGFDYSTTRVSQLYARGNVEGTYWCRRYHASRILYTGPAMS